MRKYLLVALVLFAGASSALAQTRTVTGVITDAQNQPLAGATVQVQNKNISTLTGVDGKFSLAVPNGKVVLRISYVGYKTQDLTIGANDSRIAVSMEAGTEEMGEVVI